MADENEQWSCPTCTLMNAFLAEVCEACGATSPLVLESYACEEQAEKETRHSTDGSSTTSSRSRASTRNSADNFSEDIAGEMDPWVQAEREWAHVEAHQEERPKRK